MCRRALGTALLWLAAVLPAQAMDEVPFVVTPDNVTLAMLELAAVGPDDFVLDLGSGDGRIVINAAKRFGARGLGVEIVPDLVQRSRASAAQAGVADRAVFVVQDLFQTELSVATVITMYLLQEVNLQLRPKLLALAPGTRIVSHDWDLGDWKPDRSITVAAPDKPVGQDKLSRLHLWVVPARLAGRWCAGGVQLQIEQQYQQAHVLWRDSAGSRQHGARIDGVRLQLADGTQAMLDGRRLRFATAGTFERCAS